MKKTAKPRSAFLGSKKEAGSGTAFRCCHLRAENYAVFFSRSDALLAINAVL